MFIKLTKLDNSPVWLNASFIVTVEPRKGGGSIVVPIGDGLDYDVREKPEDVLARLEGAPVPTVVPVPVSDCLTKTPEDVSPEPEAQRLAEPPRTTVPSKPVEPLKPSEAEKPDEPSALPEPVEACSSASASEVDEGEAAKEAKKAARTRTKTAKAAKPTTKKPRTTRAKKPTLDLSEDEVVRLKKMAPGSVNKLKNTLFTQFHVENPSQTMLALEAHGHLSLDRDHVVWPTHQNEIPLALVILISF